MKKLLWLISICCFLPTVTGMPSQANSLDARIAKVEAGKAVDDFLSHQNGSSSLSTAAIKNFATNMVVDGSLDILSPSSTTAPANTVKKTVKKVAGKSATGSTHVARNIVQPVSGKTNGFIAQADGCNCEVDNSGISDAQSKLRSMQSPTPSSLDNFYSPALSINNPVGLGADGGLAFLAGSFQSRTRFTQKSDGELGIGIGLGDAVNAVGVELSYTINSFGSSQNFGSGGFNAKVHKRIADDTSVAVGWNRFANIEGGTARSDYPRNSYYAVATQVVRTNESLDDAFSRIALSAGVGGGQFLSFSQAPGSLDRSGVNVFGSAAVRVAKPVSVIVEWTGQDLAAGLSIVPFQDFPLIITPAFRDISGITGETARFVLGVSTAIKF